MSDRMPPGDRPSAPVPVDDQTAKPPRKFGIGTLSVTVTATVALTVPLTLALTHGTHSVSPTAPIISTTAPPVTPLTGTHGTNGSPSAGTGGSTIIATQPFVRVNKAAIQSGGQVTITGGGFRPGETVYVDFWWGGVSNQMDASTDYSIEATGGTSGRKGERIDQHRGELTDKWK